MVRGIELVKAVKPIVVSDDMWDAVDMDNRLVAEQYLDSLTTVSDSTYNRYRIDVRQLVYWIHSGLNDKPLYEFNVADFERYMQVLRTTGIKINTIQSKKYGLCTFFNFIDETIRKVDDRYKDFVNDFIDAEIRAGIYSGASHPITYDEYLLLIDQLRREKYYIAMAWVMFVFTTGATGLEYKELSSQLVKFPFPANADYVLTNTIVRWSNKSTGDKYAINFKIRKEVYDAIKLWVDTRGYDSEFVFTSNLGGKISKVNNSWASSLCNTSLSPILGRQVSVTDFTKGGEKYMTYIKKNTADNNRRHLQNLMGIDLESEPIRLEGYERDIQKIIDDL